MPACRGGDTSKGNAEVTGWLRRKRLDEPSFLLRHIEILTALGPDGRREPRSHELSAGTVVHAHPPTVDPRP